MCIRDSNNFEATIDNLNARIAKLQAALEAAQRSAKRQAAPFRKADGPEAHPKKPGRKSGSRHGRHAHRGIPPRIDERFDAPLPEVCPHCGSRHLVETEVALQYQTEIPRTPIYRQFEIHVGQCADCGGRVQGRHELQTSDAVGAAVRLPRAVLALIDRAFGVRRAWRGHRLTADERTDAGLSLGCALEALVQGTFTYEPNRRLAAHVAAHAMHWFWFLIDPTIDATNYRAEQAMRPAVVNRKVWGGNRTWAGARAQSVLMSVVRTLTQRGVHLLQWFSSLRRSPTPLLLPAEMR